MVNWLQYWLTWQNSLWEIIVIEKFTFFPSYQIFPLTKFKQNKNGNLNFIKT